jgi:hypothetical protein
LKSRQHFASLPTANWSAMLRSPQSHTTCEGEAIGGCHGSVANPHGFALPVTHCPYF